MILAEWLIRLVVTLVLVPPLTELRSFLSELLLPALTPQDTTYRQICRNVVDWEHGNSQERRDGAD